jgi:hypothetical protein
MAVEYLKLAGAEDSLPRRLYRRGRSKRCFFAQSKAFHSFLSFLQSLPPATAIPAICRKQSFWQLVFPALT